MKTTLPSKAALLAVCLWFGLCALTCGAPFTLDCGYYAPGPGGSIYHPCLLEITQNCDTEGSLLDPGTSYIAGLPSLPGVPGPQYAPPGPGTLIPNPGAGGETCCGSEPGGPTGPYYSDNYSDIGQCRSCGTGGGGVPIYDAVGMPSWSVTEPALTFWLRDVPVWTQPGRGNPLKFKLTYRQRVLYDSLSNVFGFGPAWTGNFQTYATPLTDHTNKALVQQGDLEGGPRAAALYARAVAEGADAPLRAYVRFATMLAARYADPTAAREAGVSILAEGDDATAELAAPVVGELLMRTGDLSGSSLPGSIAPERAARTLVAAGDAALAAGERAWAGLALRTASERAPNTASGRTAATRLAALSEQPAPAAETVPHWLVREATRCQSDSLSADAATSTGDFDVLVRRQRGTARIVARVRPGAGAGAARFERCLEGPLPDPPALDGSTIYQGAIRLR